VLLVLALSGVSQAKKSVLQNAVMRLEPTGGSQRASAGEDPPLPYAFILPMHLQILNVEASLCGNSECSRSCMQDPQHAMGSRNPHATT